MSQYCSKSPLFYRTICLNRFIQNTFTPISRMSLYSPIFKFTNQLSFIGQKDTITGFLRYQLIAFTITYQSGFTSDPSDPLIPIIKVSNLLSPFNMEILILENTCLATWSFIKRCRIFICNRKDRIWVFSIT